MADIDWVEEAQKNGGILPDSFSAESGLLNDTYFAYNLISKTGKIENLTKFPISTVTAILRDYNPGLMNSVVKSACFDKEKITSIALHVPETIEFVPYEMILEVLSKEPQYVSSLPPEIKEKPEVSSLIKDILMGKVDILPRNLDRLIKSLPENLKNDEEFVGHLLKKDPTFYRYSGEKIRNNLTFTNFVISKNPELISFVGNDLLQNNSDINTLYFLENPYRFFKHTFAPKNTTNTTLLEAVLREKFANYQLLEGEALKTSVAKNVEFGFRQLEKIQRGATNNPNLMYDLVSNREIMQFPPEVLRSFLEYDSKSVQAIIEISKQEKLDGLKKFIDWTFEKSGKNQRSAYNAIVNYQPVSDLVQNLDFQNLLFNENNTLRHIVATKNPYNVQTVQELQKYPQRLKDDCLKQENLASMKDKVFQVMGYTAEDLTKIKESFPQSAKHFPTIRFLDDVIASQDINSLKEKISNTDFNRILRDPGTLHQQFAHAYENEYRKSCLNLSDLETTVAPSGVEIKDLGKRPFKMFMHRIFNFDESLSENVKILMEKPEKWKTLTGASYISTSFITDKSIKGVFRPLKDGKSDLWRRSSEENIETLQKKVENFKKGKNELTEIDPTAVFLGFSEIPEGSLISMAPIDMMTEHGGKHADVKTQSCKFYSPDDLAYSTTGPWNEVALTRENPQNGKRIMPTCIICFDQHINPESLHFAKSMNLPIVNINRANYAESNQEEREQSKNDFKKTLSRLSLKKLFYSTPMDDMIDFQAQEILGIINTNQSASQKDKIKALSFLDEQFHRLVSEQAVMPSRFYPEEKLQKLQETYVSDGEKIDKILSGIKQSQETLSHKNSLVGFLSQASQQGKNEKGASASKSHLKSILTQASEKVIQPEIKNTQKKATLAKPILPDFQPDI